MIKILERTKGFYGREGNYPLLVPSLTHNINVHDISYILHKYKNKNGMNLQSNLILV